MTDSSFSLRAGRLSFIDVLGHTLANITPSAMATVTLSLVVANGGLLTWAVYLVVGVLMLGVATQVATLSRLVPSAGSLFVSVGRTLHPLAGLLSGWSMVGGYLGALLAAPVVGGMFLAKALGILGWPVTWPPVAVVFALCAWYLTVRDTVLAVRYSLYVELVSLAAIIVVGFSTLHVHGFVDPAQWHASFSGRSFFSAMTLSVLAYGGFETAANLGREGRRPARDVPMAIIASVLVCMVFYVFMSYAEVLGYANSTTAIARTASPLSDLAVRDHLPFMAFISDGAMAVAAFSAAIATMNSLGRLIYSMARHQVFPDTLGVVGAHRTPAVALHVLGFLAAGFALLSGLAHWRVLAIIDLFGVFTALGFIVIYVLAMFAVVVHYLRSRQRPPFFSWLLLLTAAPLLGYVFGQSFWGAHGPALAAAYAFVVYLLGGAAMYLWRGRGVRALVFAARQDD